MGGQPLRVFLQHLRTVLGPRDAEGLPDHQLLERFLDRHDAAAFEALLERYCPMVLSVCRRVLAHEQDAEDAFQATFLVLVRKAASIRKQESIGGWLYGVAYRIAVKARALAARRRLKEKPTPERLDAVPLTEVIRRDVHSVLDEELNRLPEKYRTPIILCYLQGKTNEEAAQLLSWPAGTLKTRLAQARGLLQTRLARRGCTLSVAALAAFGEQTTAAVTLPAAIAHSTIKVATLLVAEGFKETGGMSGPVATLLASTLRTMLIAKVRVACLLLFITTVLATGAGLAMHQGLTAKPGAERFPEQPPMRAHDASSAKSANQQLARTDLYGDPLPAGARARLGTTRWRHDTGIFDLIFSPDQRIIAASSSRIVLWDVATGKELCHLPVRGLRGGLHFSPDGKTLAVAEQRPKLGKRFGS